MKFLSAIVLGAFAFSALAFSALAFSALAFCSQANAQSAQEAPVTECDKVAAHPRDPDRMATGIELNAIVPRPALSACREAVEKYPNSGRLWFQLGRAQSAYQGSKAGQESYQKAAVLGHLMAHMNIGSYQAEQNDLDNARASFEKCKSIEACREWIVSVSYSSEGLSNREFFDSAYAGTLPNGGSKVLAQSSIYMTQFLSKFNATSSCTSVVPKSLVFEFSRHVQQQVFSGMLGALKDSRAAGTLGYKEGQNLAGGFAMQESKAESDAQTLYTRYGCDNPILKRLMANFQTWASANNR